MTEIVAIVQCRLSSTRLPEKILLTLNDEPVIWHVINRLRKSKKIQKIIIATTKEKEDDEICRWCDKESLDYFRGETENVLSRYFHCAESFKANNIVRVTSDCPLVDPEIIDKTIELFLKEKSDYASNNLKKTFPHGLDVEVFTYKALKETYINATKKTDKEHVTQYMRRKTEKFKLNNLSSNINLSDIRITIDEQEDFVLIKKIADTYGKDTTYRDIANFFLKFPELKKLNQSAKKRHKNYNKTREII